MSERKESEAPRGSRACRLPRGCAARNDGLNGRIHPSAPPIAAFVPMDGFHLTRAQLDALPDPANAHARRGAEFTFDGEGFLKLVQRLRAPLTSSSSVVYAPSFDHAVKDPKEDDIMVDVSHRIIVFEGNCKASGESLADPES